MQLQKTLGFELQERDVTFQPEIVRGKGLRSVPVIDVNARQLVGNATSAQLAAFLENATIP